MRSLALLTAALCLLGSAQAAALSLDIPRPDTAESLHDEATPSGLAVQPVLRAGVPVPLEVDVQASDWHSAGDGTAVWSLTLNSADASFLGLRLNAPQLPEGAELRLLGEDGQLRGPYANEHRNSRGQLWIPVVHGDSAELELRAPSAATSEVQLGAVELHYGLHPLDGTAPATKAQGDAGGCHNDVACPQGTDWPRAIRSTALLIIGNQLVCNGVLLNNTRDDGDPLVITADHCGIRADDDADGFPAESVTAVFNFQAEQCDSTRRVAQADDIEGAELLFRHRSSDTTLIRLDRAPPADFNARYAGWDASGNGAASGSGVHHPSGDLKKISLFEQPLSAGRVTISDGGTRTGSQEVEAWRVDWADGVTEPGSSGSGIWNPQQQLLGVLSGGSSQCGTDGLLLGIGAQPEIQGPDFYGRLAVAFDSPGELGTPLRSFLDPAASGARSLNARGAAAGGPGPSNGGAGGSDSGGGGAAGFLSLLLLGAAAWRHRTYRRSSGDVKQ